MRLCKHNSIVHGDSYSSIVGFYWVQGSPIGPVGKQYSPAKDNGALGTLELGRPSF